MASTTPTSAPPGRQRSTSRDRRNISRPTTPLRAPSRTSLRASTTNPQHNPSTSPDAFPLNALEPAFSELSDSMADLEANMMHLQLLHESLSRFNECFGSFLYGLNMSAFCVDFPEAPGPESYKRARDHAERQAEAGASNFGGSIGAGGVRADVDATFLTTDTSFVENPPTPGKPSRGAPAPAPPSARGTRTTRGNVPAGRGRGAPTRGGRTVGSVTGTTRGPSSVARGRGRGVIR